MNMHTEIASKRHAPLPRPAPRRSTSRCRAAARTARSPGACSTGCSRTSGSRFEGHQRHQRRRGQCRRALLWADGRRARRRQAGAENLLAAHRAMRRCSRRCSRRPGDRLTHNHGLENSPAYAAFDILSRVFSPYQLNPLNINPLEDRCWRRSSISRSCSATAR